LRQFRHFPGGIGCWSLWPLGADEKRNKSQVRQIWVFPELFLGLVTTKGQIRWVPCGVTWADWCGSEAFCVLLVMRWVGWYDVEPVGCGAPTDWATVYFSVQIWQDPTSLPP
jgi:hypothetical protein